jgi:hypothetical protein
MHPLIEVPVTIKNGTSLSDAEVNLGAYRLVGVRMPDDWTAAAITFTAKDSHGDWYKVVDGGGTELSIATPAKQTVIHLAEASQPRGLGVVKVMSGPAAGRVNQGADRALVLLLTEL